VVLFSFWASAFGLTSKTHNSAKRLIADRASRRTNPRVSRTLGFGNEAAQPSMHTVDAEHRAFSATGVQPPKRLSGANGG
jgi:hypothetical protein